MDSPVETKGSSTVEDGEQLSCNYSFILTQNSKKGTVYKFPLYYKCKFIIKYTLIC